MCFQKGDDDKQFEIKRPRNAFIIYIADHRKKYTQDNPGLHQSEICKLLGSRWKKEPASVRSTYEKRANKEKDFHQKCFPDYKYKPKKTRTATKTADVVVSATPSISTVQFELPVLPTAPKSQVKKLKQNTNKLSSNKQKGKKRKSPANTKKKETSKSLLKKCLEAHLTAEYNDMRIKQEPQSWEPYVHREDGNLPDYKQRCLVPQHNEHNMPVELENQTSQVQLSVTAVTSYHNNQNYDWIKQDPWDFSIESIHVGPVIKVEKEETEISEEDFYQWQTSPLPSSEVSSLCDEPCSRSPIIDMWNLTMHVDPVIKTEAEIMHEDGPLQWPTSPEDSSSYEEIMRSPFLSYDVFCGADPLDVDMMDMCDFKEINFAHDFPDLLVK